jgi:predicted amidophosphoribosyltransferase
MVAFVYTTFIKKLIIQLKFGHKYDVASFLAQRLALLIQTNPSFIKALREWTLFISFVPSHRRRKYFVKWYNQSEFLAHHVAHELQIPLIQWIKKQKYTVSQTQCSRKQRLTNLIDAFIIQDKTSLPDWATLIVVDDIATTGSTLDEIAKIRKKQQPTISIRWAVVWRHGK